MKLKTFFSNGIRDNMKKQLWLPSLVALVMFIAFPVACLLATGQPKYLDPLSYDQLAARFRDIIGFPHAALLNTGAALLIGVTEFSYLHSRKKVDFYHSLPLKRSQLFWQKLLTGLLCYALPYLAAVLLAVCVGAAQGIFSASMLGLGLLSYLVNLLFFLLNYLVVVLAMLLTGRLLTGILGSLVFMVYGPVLSVLCSSYAEMYFSSYFESGSLFQFVKVLSPAAWESQVLLSLEKATGGETELNRLTAFLEGGMDPLAALLITVLVTGALLFLCLWIYNRRPSEAAEQSMAFKKAATAIKFLIVIPASMGVGAFFRGLAPSYAEVWNIFGMLLGLLVFYGIIETIYAMDFRKLFSHKLQLALAAAGVCAVFLCFRLDVTGYDSYMPDKEDLQAVEISVDSLGSMGYYGERCARLNVDEEVYRILKSIDANAIDTSSGTDDAGTEEYQNLTGILIRYLEGDQGEKAVARRYTVDFELVKEDIGKLFNQESFKEAVFSLATLDPQFEGSLVFMHPQGRFTLADTGDEKDIAGLLKAYREDVKEMDSGDLGGMPIGQLAVDSWYGKEMEVSHDLIDGLVLSNFKRTRAYLQKLGVKLWTDMKPEDVDSITVDYLSGEEQYTAIKDKESIQKLLPYMTPTEFYFPWQELESEGSGSVVMKGSEGTDSAISCNFLTGFREKIGEITVK